MGVGRGDPTQRLVCTHDASVLTLTHTKSESGISCKRVSLCKNWNYSQSCDVDKNAISPIRGAACSEVSTVCIAPRFAFRTQTVFTGVLEEG